MSSTGNCYDNAAAESFFATVKLETISEGIFASRRQAHAALFDYEVLTLKSGWLILS